MIKSLILSILLTIVFVGCTKEEPKPTMDIIKNKVENSWEETKNYTNEKYDDTKELVSDKYKKIKNKLFKDN